MKLLSITLLDVILRIVMVMFSMEHDHGGIVKKLDEVTIKESIAAYLRYVIGDGGCKL